MNTVLQNPNSLGPLIEGMHWEEVGPRRLVVGELINTIDVGDGRVWRIERSLSKMDLILTTDIPYASEEEAEGRPFKVFVLRGAPIVEQLCRGLLGR